MRKVIYPGSFDPLTNGHLDIIQRAAALFDEVEVVILQNETKKNTFSEEERLAFLQSNTKELRNVTCSVQNGLTVRYASLCGACAMVRGIRSMKDFLYEDELTQINHVLAPEIETIYLPCSPKYQTISSSAIKEFVKYGESISAYVPKDVEEAMLMKRGM